MTAAKDGPSVSFRTAAAIAALILIARVALLSVSAGKWPFLLLDDLIFIATSALAAACLIFAARRLEGPSRRAWMALAGAQAAFALGELVWGVIEVGLRQNPFPSLADAAFIAFYPAFFWGIGVFLLPDEPLTSRQKQKIAVDLGIIIVSAALIVWIFWLAPLSSAGISISWKLLLLTAYPVMDMLLFSILLVLLFRKIGTRTSLPLALLALALVMLIITDVIFSVQIQRGTYVPGGPLDTGWLIYYLLLGLAGVLQASQGNRRLEPQPEEALSRGRAIWTHYLPCLSIGGAAILIVFGSESLRSTDFPPAALSLGLVVGLMLMHQKITLDESRESLARTLAEIEERKRVEEDLKKARALAESATKAKSDFLASMSHEIRTPMNAVIGIASLLQEENLTPQQREYAKIIHDSGELLLIIINDILDLSKIECGMMNLECKPFYLNDCVDKSIKLISSKAQGKGLSLSYNLEKGIPEVIAGDSLRLSQVLINLLGNAVKFTDRGSVSLSVSDAKLKDDIHEIHFAVKDTGIGIPRDKMDRLFQSFYRVEGDSSRRYEGTGLGLAISKRLVELMGGRIWAESEPKTGSTFHFTILAKAGSADLVSSGQTEGVPDGRTTKMRDSLRILLAEDNPVNQKVAGQMLSKLGYRAEVVSSGLEALKALESKNYDVVLMDLQMPEMDGLEASRAIRARWPDPVRPWIIALTACALEEDRRRCLDAGMNEYLSKPIQMDELRRKLAQCEHR